MSEQSPRAGARPARRAGDRVTSLPLGPAVVAVVVLLVAGLLILVTPARPETIERPVTATGSAVQQTTVDCSGLPTAPEAVKTSFGVGLASADGLGTDGSVATTPGSTLSLSRGRSVAVPGTTERGLVVQGEGGLAQGLFAWRADTGPSTAVLDCQSPRASWWFTGAGAALDHESTLTLANLDSGPAEIDIRVLSPDGEADVTASGGKGISLAPGAQVALSLVELAPQSDELAIWVNATRGRVVAAVHDRFAGSPGGKPGFEWLPSQVSPSRLVRLSGVPASARRRTLLVANPGDRESVVRVEVAGRNGRFVPADVGELSVPPATVQTVDLTDVLPGEVLAVRIRAGRPVLASLRSVRASSDLAYAGAALPLRGPAALPVVGNSSVQLTGGTRISRLILTAYSSAGESVGETRISLAAHATDIWDVPAGAAYVLVVPTQGNAFGSMLYTGSGPGASAVPLRDLPTSIRVPAVRPGG